MFRPSPDRAVRMYVAEDDGEASCRICGQTFPDRDAAAGHVRGLLAVDGLGDHCRIHGFEQEPGSPARVPRLSTPSGGGEDPDEDRRERRWSLLELFSFRL